MKIVKVWGGLGNQLFCYGLYRELKNKYDYDVYVDLNWYDNPNRKYYYPYQLESMGLKADVLGKKSKFYHSYFELELVRLIEKKSYGFLFKILYSILRIGRPKIGCLRPKNEFEYIEKVFDNDDTYLIGYWLNRDYMKNALEQIIGEVEFLLDYDKENKLMQQRINNSEAVAIHIRRNDYEHEKFDAVCNDEYYLKGMDIFRQKLNNPTFFVFSNRISAAKEVLGEGADIVYVDINGRNSGLYDMKLMSMCKGMIISNSTFSWWSAALVSGNGGTVVFPEEWNRREQLLNLKMDEWIEL